MMKLRQYKLAMVSRQVIKMPGDAKVLCVIAKDNENPRLQVIVEEDVLESPEKFQDRTFLIAYQEDKLFDKEVRFIGTFEADQELYLIFEVLY